MDEVHLQGRAGGELHGRAAGRGTERLLQASWPPCDRRSSNPQPRRGRRHAPQAPHEGSEKKRQEQQKYGRRRPSAAGCHFARSDMLTPQYMLTLRARRDGETATRHAK